MRVTARDLAVMAATIAAGGVNPLTGEQVVDQVSRCALVVMATAGCTKPLGVAIHETGCRARVARWRDRHGLARQGRPGAFAPRLDAAGNSVKGQLAAAFLSRQLGLDLFVSAP